MTLQHRFSVVCTEKLHLRSLYFSPRKECLALSRSSVQFPLPHLAGYINLLATVFTCVKNLITQVIWCDRVLSEYLGEDKMLALVCKSPQFGPNSVQYRRFQSEAAKLGRSITNNRLHVRCLESDDTTRYV